MAKKPPVKKPAPTDSVPRAVTDNDLRKLAERHIPVYQKLLEAKKKADKAIKDLGKVIKSDLGDRGMQKIKAMIELETPEGEARVRAEARALAEAMAWGGVELGEQVVMLFDEPSREPLADKAFKQGEADSRTGKPRSPKYDPTTEAYRNYMAGYDKNQEKSAATIGRGDGKDLRPRHLQQMEADRKGDAKPN